MKIKSQGLIEFVVIIPLVIVVVFGIIEFTLFWRAVQTTQQIAVEAGVVVARTTVNPTSTTNQAVLDAVNFVQGRVASLGINGLSMTGTVISGTAPYAAYEYKGGIAPNGQPLIKLIIDYRNPYERGIVTQMVYNYRTLLVGIAFKIPGGKEVVIIPRDIPISSSKVYQYQVY